MSTLELLKNLGLYIEPNFLPTEFCDRFLDEAQTATCKPALLWKPDLSKNLNLVEDETQRKTEQVIVSDPMIAEIQDRLLALKPSIEKKFDLELKDCQNPLFYRYKEGCFFGAHRDSCDQPLAPEFLRQRRVSTIIFLNQRTEDISFKSSLPTYCGGSLAFYGLIDNPHWQNCGIPVPSQPGMLVAFRSEMLHEVKKVTAGERYTIVSWFV
jgi:predicted 2-oxoglutarate/Fe(II)-dependent dioxygenase YbiX